MRLWLISSVDSWFFRGAVSFNAGEGGAQDIPSQFPPPITAVQGLVRQVLALGQGWTPDNRAAWPAAELGDGDKLGKLELKGPYLLDAEKQEWLFPAPLHLVKDKQNNLGFLTPSREVYETDLGQVRLPVASDPRLGEGIANVTQYVTLDGLTSILTGKVPGRDQLRATSELWEEEFRVGIELEQATRTAKDTHLYSTRHIRVKDDIKIGVITGGDIPESWFPREEVLMPFGGEGRLARVEVTKGDPPVPGLPVQLHKKDKLQVTATLITPGRYGLLTGAVICQGPLPEVQCVTACVGKLYQAGGWDLKARKPKPLEPVIPAGSTWFYELTEEEFELIKKYHGQPTGCYATYGYGQVVLGTWKEEN